MDNSLLASPELRPSEFEMIRDLAMKTFGLDLRAGKERLVAARLTKHLRAGGFRTFRQYYDRVRSDSSGELLIGLIDSLTTNHTGFLREPSHFDFLSDLLRTEYRNRHRVDIWCAASATGEEPYTLLFTALSCNERPVPADVRILASDISTRAFTRARFGAASGMDKALSGDRKGYSARLRTGEGRTAKPDCVSAHQSDRAASDQYPVPRHLLPKRDDLFQ
jgi:chemotaxis protein methyltransferase CheR